MRHMLEVQLVRYVFVQALAVCEEIVLLRITLCLSFLVGILNSMTSIYK